MVDPAFAINVSCEIEKFIQPCCEIDQLPVLSPDARQPLYALKPASFIQW